MQRSNTGSRFRVDSQALGVEMAKGLEAFEGNLSEFVRLAAILG